MAVAIPKSIEYSPQTTLASGFDSSTDTELSPTLLSAFPSLSAGEIGIVVLCAEGEFRSNDPADFETCTYTAVNGGTGELEGLVHCEGTARAWPSGTYICCPGTAYGWEQVRAAIAELYDSENIVYDGATSGLSATTVQGAIDEVDSDLDTHAGNTTTAHGAVSAATASKIIIRDAEGKAKVAESSTASDIAIVSQTTSKLPLAGGTMTGPLDMDDQIVLQPDIKDYVETLATATWDSASQTINLENGNIHSVSITAAVTSLTISNPRAGAHPFTLVVAQGGTLRAITWPGSVAWAGGSAPTMAINKTYWITFVTLNGGTNWTGFLAGEV